MINIVIFSLLNFSQEYNKTKVVIKLSAEITAEVI